MKPHNRSVHAGTFGMINVSFGGEYEFAPDGRHDLSFATGQITHRGLEYCYYLSTDEEALAFAEDFRRLAAEIESIVRQRRAARQVAPAIMGENGGA